MYELQSELKNLTELSRSSHDPNLGRSVKEKKRSIKKIFDSKVKHYEKQIRESSNVSKTTWKIIGEEINIKNKHIETNIALNSDGSEIKDPCVVSNMFNDHYINLVETNVIPKLNQVAASSNISLPNYTDKVLFQLV